VLEDRGKPAGRQLLLAVTILKATGSERASDPIVFLSGGPGVPSLEGDMLNFTADIARP
jgi:hypothetical protein